VTTNLFQVIADRVAVCRAVKVNIRKAIVKLGKGFSTRSFATLNVVDKDAARSGQPLTASSPIEIIPAHLL